jgi:hypothetical protein
MKVFNIIEVRYFITHRYKEKNPGAKAQRIFVFRSGKACSGEE